MPLVIDFSIILTNYEIHDFDALSSAMLRCSMPGFERRLERMPIEDITMNARWLAGPMTAH